MSYDIYSASWDFFSVLSAKALNIRHNFIFQNYAFQGNRVSHFCKLAIFVRKIRIFLSPSILNFCSTLAGVSRMEKNADRNTLASATSVSVCKSVRTVILPMQCGRFAQRSTILIEVALSHSKTDFYFVASRHEGYMRRFPIGGVF